MGKNTVEKPTIYEFQPKPIAPTIDDIIEAQLKGYLVGAPNVREALKILNKNQIEQFNFGPLSLSTVREAQAEAVEFIELGCFTFPYPVCLYRAQVQYDNAMVGMTVLVVDGRDKVPVIHKYYDGVASVTLIHSQNEMCAMHAINMLNVQLDSQGHGKAVELHVPQTELEYWKDKIDIGGPFGYTEENTGPLTEGAMLAMGLTMILNTKGIRRERSEPPCKPQQARIRAGKPLLPYVTRVYTDVYNKAVEKGEPGTHASPRPHRRRAHVRHLPERGNKPAYNIPIAAMLVNWDGEPLTPHQYEVK